MRQVRDVCSWPKLILDSIAIAWLYVLPAHVGWLCLGQSSGLQKQVAYDDLDLQKLTVCTLSFLQPAKLAEAFKYFVQGMGYSKYDTLGARHMWGW